MVTRGRRFRKWHFRRGWRMLTDLGVVTFKRSVAARPWSHALVHRGLVERKTWDPISKRGLILQVNSRLLLSSLPTFLDSLWQKFTSGCWGSPPDARPSLASFDWCMLLFTVVQFREQRVLGAVFVVQIICWSYYFAWNLFGPHWSFLSSVTWKALRLRLLS